MKHTLIRTVPEARPADAFSGCGRGPAPPARRAANAPPVFVSGVAIPEAAIAQEAQNHAAASGPEARAAAARALVIRELPLQRARTLGLHADPKRDERGREETADEALVRQVLELEAPAVEPSEAECRRVHAARAASGEAPTFEAAEAAIRARLRERAAIAAAARYVARLAASAEIVGLSLTFGARQ